MLNIEVLRNCPDTDIAPFLAYYLGCGEVFVRLWLNQEQEEHRKFGPCNKYKEYPDNLLFEVLGGSNMLRVDFTSNHRSALFEAMEILTPREKYALHLYYDKGYTYRAIGEVLFITGPRVREIIRRAIRILRSAKAIKYIDKFGTEQEDTATNTPQNVFDVQISDLNLSTRSLNCLRRAGIFTVGDFLLKSDTDVKNIKNLGLRSYAEIRNKIDDVIIAFHKRNEEEEL